MNNQMYTSNLHNYINFKYCSLKKFKQDYKMQEAKCS